MSHYSSTSENISHPLRVRGASPAGRHSQRRFFNVSPPAAASPQPFFESNPPSKYVYKSRCEASNPIVLPDKKIVGEVFKVR